MAQPQGRQYGGASEMMQNAVRQFYLWAYTQKNRKQGLKYIFSDPRS